jgi:hypothetical protein
MSASEYPVSGAVYSAKRWQWIRAAFAAGSVRIEGAARDFHPLRAHCLYAIAIFVPENGSSNRGLMMVIAAVDRDVAEGHGLRRFLVRHSVFAAWAAMALFLVLCHLVGYSPASDLDDLLKQVEIRNFLETGAWFDRTIPGILQPEPFASHWPRLVDLPYAAVAAPLGFLIGRESALSAASFAVPLLLLWLALYFYRRVIGELESERPSELFLMTLLPAAPAFFEFAPDRIDYHNLELVFLFCSLWLAMDRRAAASAANGIVVAFAFGMGLEFAVFYAAVMAAYAVDFLMERTGAERRLALFGTALACTGLFVFLIIVPPGHYGTVTCDTYSAPHLFALACAGLSFAAAGYLARKPGSFRLRAVALAIPAGLALAGLVYLFPECHGGPFSAVSRYVMTNWVGHILQDKSLLHRPDVVLSPQIGGVALVLVGAAAMVAVGLKAPRSRNLVLFAAFTLLALLHGYFLIRYFRYLGFFAGPGLVLTLAALLNRARAPGGILAGALMARLPSAPAMLAPGVLLVAVTIGSYFIRHVPRNTPASGAEFAGDCDPTQSTRLEWPRGAGIFAPPTLGIQILAAEPSGPATIVATPHHPAWRGIERVYRFLDPRTPDPRQYLDQSRATHVVVCAWHGRPLAKLEKSYPLTAALTEGSPPAWLVECPLPASSPIRVYRYPSAGGAADACPTTSLSAAG